MLGLDVVSSAHGLSCALILFDLININSQMIKKLLVNVT